ncbi:MAG: gluconate:H+ symporter [Verrucomicrobiota bacterium]|jgi:GntP family gluconate:H+ symporter
MTASDSLTIALAVAGIVVLVALITWARLNAFLALLVAALFVGAGSSRPMLEVAKAFQDGMGATLGGTAAVIGLGTMIGKLLAESRGAEVLAKRFVVFFGPRRIGWCVMAIAMVVGLTTWFAVGLILLAPILHTLTRETKRPFLHLALPLLACLSVMHGFMPPHPGPVMAINALHANAGMVLVWGFVIGIPTAAIAGPAFARLASKRVKIDPSVSAAVPLHPGACWPGFGLTLFSMLLPVGLMLVATVTDLVAGHGRLRDTADFVGNPTIALLVAVLFAHWSMGSKCGFTLRQLLKFGEEAIAGVGMTILIVGGGGGFARVLQATGAADAMGAVANAAHLSPLLYGWLVSAFIRVATGSATVAITAASAFMAPVLARHPGTNTELAVIAIGCGSLFLSHLNDGGFWIVKEYLNLTVMQTLRTWTLCETIIGLAGLALTLLASALL